MLNSNNGFRWCEQVSLVTYARSDATVQLAFSNYTTEDGVIAGIDLVPFIPAVDAELFWGLQALNNTVFQGSDPSRADARLVCMLQIETKICEPK